MSIHAPSRKGFQSLLRIASASIADPPWFAAPVEAEEDENAMTLIFHVPKERHDHVRVQASDQSVTVWAGPAHARQRRMRLCALPCPIVASGVETARSGELLRVRVPKKRPATDEPEASAPST
jgi:HSP20 family molecular chaperone IbpA